MKRGLLYNNRYCGVLSDYFIYCKLRGEMLPNQLTTTFIDRQIETMSKSDPLVHQQDVE